MEPEATSVMASPMLKQMTSAKPNTNFFNCRQISSTVNAAGHGSNPPDKPNKIN